MGRHSADDDRIFWKSLVLALIKWVAVAALPLLAIWGIWRMVGKGEPQVPAAVVTTEPTQEPSPAEVLSSPPPAEEEPSPSPSPAPAPVERGQVQVLNGTPRSGLANEAADRLRGAGYQVVSVGRAARSYDKTTVFFQPGYEAMAADAADLLGAEVIEPAPDNVSKSVPLTIVVGGDFA